MSKFATTKVCTVMLAVCVLLAVCVSDSDNRDNVGLLQHFNTDEACDEAMQHIPDLKCDELLPGQYYCKDPEIDDYTQQAKDCDNNTRTAPVYCYPAPNITCRGLHEEDGIEPYFTKRVTCKWTNGKHFSTALLLSVFLGMFGIDRFYLGYPAIGVVKLCTMGFMFLGQLLDIILIAMQVVKPSDGSDYIMDYYGAGVTLIKRDNYTYMVPP